jgi:LDH2 family malate/lactate/ureidoglycolate dehydrogenase
MERIFDYDQLWQFTKNVFSSIGCREEHAATAASGLLRADLRGIDSHGIARLTGYIRLWEANRATKPNLQLVHETPSTGCRRRWRAWTGSCSFAMDLAISKAKMWVADGLPSGTRIIWYRSPSCLKALKRR